MTPLAGTHAEAGEAAGAFWTRPAEALFADLSSGTDGLPADEARARLARLGENTPLTARRRSLLLRILAKLAEPLVAILLMAGLASGLLGDWESFGVIAVIVMVSTGLDIVQERHAETVVDALRHSVSPTARVQRPEGLVDEPARRLVPGDVVVLRAGGLVPADGVVFSARDMLVNEALLTGEPYPVEKRPGVAQASAAAEASNALFSGTSVVAGEGRMLVVATGAHTQFGAIAASLQARAAPTAFERGVHALGMLILRLTGFLVLFVMLVQLLGRGLTLETFLFAVALAVGLTPELLPMVMTVTLARGAIRMSRRKVVVKRLSAIHDFGAMDVLCTDKTGTLTEARIAHAGGFSPDGADSARATMLARLNSVHAGGVRSAMDDALVAVPEQPGEAGWASLGDLPFDFERRRSSVLLAQDDRRVLVVKGAPESVLERTTRWEGPDGASFVPDEARRAALARRIEQEGAAGRRLLAVACRPMASASPSLTLADESDLALVGFVAFVDPPKASATEAVARLRRAGIRIKILSGDSGAVVQHLVDTLRLPAHGLLAGSQIQDMTDAALARAVERHDLFVRVTPDQKQRIVRALRARGHAVGFMGDGINDAPAIHAADVGLSVEGGTEVAREAADIVLLEPNLEVLADGIAEGRRTYANIMKYVRMGTSSNFGNMLSVALGSLVLPFLPLSPVQILLNNLLYDVSEVGIPFDTADPETLARPQAWDMRQVLRFTLVMGPLSSLFDAATFFLLLRVFDAGVDEFRTAWFVESIITQVLVIFVIRTARPFWASRPHPVVVATSLGALAAALGIALTPVGHAFAFVPLPGHLLLAIAGLSVGYLACAEVLKRFAMPATHGRSHRHG
ncbi:MAG: magnesium-translocating P-type ATPase [Alsobacter sp.]